MFTIGCHLSVTKGFYHMARTATELGANTFQFFPRNPRGGAAKPLAKEDIRQLEEWMDTHGFGEILCHGAYTMNGASTKEEVREFARTAIREDLAKVSLLPRCLYNFHPGAHLKQGTAVAIPLIADMVNYAMDQEGLNTTVLFETMAGKGTEVGRTFEELAEIISRVERKDHVGVCLDTCHVWDGGYDIVNDLDDVLNEFDRVIGLDRLKAVHFNDSMNDCGSHKDRHAKIGEGKIGAEAMRRVALHPLLEGRPFILETPNDDEGYRREIQMVREWTR